MDFSHTATIITLALALAAFARTFFRDNSKDLKTETERNATDKQEVQKQHAELSNRVSLLERMMDMIFKQVSINFAANLHKPHPDYAERDGLIEKFVREQITPTEMQRFRLMLERDRDNVDCDFKDQALAKSILELMDMRYALRVSSPVLETI